MQRQQKQNKKVGLHQTKKLLYNKGNHQQNEKATYRMEENIYKSYIQSGINIQSIKDLLQPKNKKISKPSKKMGKGLE